MEDDRAEVIQGLKDVYQDWHWCTDAEGKVKHPNGRLNNAIVKAIRMLKEDGGRIESLEYSLTQSFDGQGFKEEGD